MEALPLRESSAKIALQQAGWLAHQPGWLRDSFLSCARLRSFRRGEFAYHIDDEPGGMFGVAEGSFGVLVPSGGELSMCHLLRPGAWFGAGPVLTAGRRTMSFKAVEASQALFVTLAELQAIGARHPELYRRLGGLSEQAMQSIAARVVGDLLIPSGEQRIAAVLARLAGGGTGESPVAIPLSQQVIGQISNSSRDRVNRTLRRFEKSGWVELRYQAVLVTDLAALEEFARHGG
jgi:CRP/FNR family transcriptional regulator, cyclic AMP receptor protein